MKTVQGRSDHCLARVLGVYVGVVAVFGATASFGLQLVGGFGLSLAAPALMPLMPGFFAVATVEIIRRQGLVSPGNLIAGTGLAFTGCAALSVPWLTHVDPVIAILLGPVAALVLGFAMAYRLLRRVADAMLLAVTSSMALGPLWILTFVVFTHADQAWAFLGATMAAFLSIGGIYNAVLPTGRCSRAARPASPKDST